MASWAGFSDEELRRLQLKDQPVSNPGQGRGRKPTPSNRSRQQLQRERALKLAAQMTDGTDTLPPEQKLTKPQVTSSTRPAPSAQAVVNNREEEPVTTKQGAVNSHGPPEPPPEITPVAKELEKEEVELREKTRLEKLQEEQRVMEERNKQKKALLTKTIAEKSKQTQAEAVKLKRIQRELQVLDDSVSSDINILRKLIEQASLDYSIAWKRFERAEAEYVSAKLSLHQRTEAKEQLTEHLCAIIQQNELRKAAKLEELMQQLELSTDAEPPTEHPHATQPPAQDSHGPQHAGVTPQLPGIPSLSQVPAPALGTDSSSALGEQGSKQEDQAGKQEDQGGKQEDQGTEASQAPASGRGPQDPQIAGLVNSSQTPQIPQDTPTSPL
ncbi:hypothetical protein ACEWY4_014161 [Coilia grayii]|uniref:RAB6-interacting golgin n=1 Tax=Coilia grayii TaxID=363190 RepID=A0ABD1JRH6_9TELE